MGGGKFSRQVRDRELYNFDFTGNEFWNKVVAGWLLFTSIISFALVAYLICCPKKAKAKKEKGS